MANENYNANYNENYNAAPLFYPEPDQLNVDNLCKIVLFRGHNFESRYGNVKKKTWFGQRRVAHSG